MTSKILSLILVLVLCAVPALAATFESLDMAMAADEEFPKVTDPEYADCMFVIFMGIGGQDSFLIACGGETMLVDCGTWYAGYDVYKRLGILGVERLDYAVCTHPHDDHIKGFMPLMDLIEIGTIITAHPANYNEQQRSFVKKAEEKGIDVRLITAEDDISFGGNTIKLWKLYNGSDVNRTSLVMKVTFGERSVLLPADITEPEEKTLAARYADELGADILKLPHHGITVPQPMFMNAVGARLCILTNTASGAAGATKSWFYDHPDSVLLRTPIGDICCYTDGKNWRVKQLKLTNDPLTKGK